MELNLMKNTCFDHLGKLDKPEPYNTGVATTGYKNATPSGLRKIDDQLCLCDNTGVHTTGYKNATPTGLRKIDDQLCLCDKTGVATTGYKNATPSGFRSPSLWEREGAGGWDIFTYNNTTPTGLSLIGQNT
jgi:hypothetical protein